ncbi:MAG: hypothetical protein L3K26_17345, partial [Candidatus Hydrogenedentes bacterium]|nr:hypothetical protein [Candidatus Hydrogenedentota bacterium]
GRYDGPASRIADAIEIRTGVRPELVRDTAYDASLTIDAHAIVLGNRSTNSLLGTLYERYYTLLDLRYPGAGGYVVRTLHNPTGTGKNLVLLGGSDDAGVEAATNAFALVIGDAKPSDGELTIGRLMDIQLGDGIVVPTDINRFPTWEDSAGYGSIGYFGWNSISKRMALYYMTGDPFHAREFIRLAFPDAQAKQEINDIDGERIENKDEPLSGPYHYNAHMMILFWDLIEESPVFSDEERLRVTRAFAKQLEHPGIQRAYRGPYAATPGSVGSRHGQWTAISLYCLGRYFAKDYDDPVWPVCEENGALHFRSLHEHAWVTGESDNLYWYNTGTAPILTYMMLTGDRVPLENGVLGKLLRAQEALFAGKQNDWALRYGSIGYYHKAADLMQDGRWLDYVAHSGISRRPFRLGQSYWPVPELKPTLPEDLVGVWNVNPLPEPMWRQRKSGLPLAESFQFASYRTAPDASGDFILLDGFNGASRNPYHTFALLELRQDGETILEGYMNQLRTRADGLTEPKIAMDAALRKHMVLGDVAIAVGEVPDMPYASWKRTIISRKGKYTLIADAVTPRIDTDNFEIELSWQSKASSWRVDLEHWSRILATTKPKDLTKWPTISVSREMETKVDGLQATMTWVGPVKAGETQYIFSVVGRGEGEVRLGIDAWYMGAEFVALQLPQPAAVEIDTDAEGGTTLSMTARDHYIGMNVMESSWQFESDVPATVYWDYAAAEISVSVSEPATMLFGIEPVDVLMVDGVAFEVSLIDEMCEVFLEPGIHQISGALPFALALAIEQEGEAKLKAYVAERNAEEEVVLPQPTDTPLLTPESTYTCGESVVDLIQIPHEDGPVLAAAAGTTIHLIGQEGTGLRQFKTDGPIRMLRWWAEH